MASSSSHQQGNGHFISNSPYFFKIILQDTIQNGKLGIPRKFVKNHGKCMPSPALLRVPSGAAWKVELTKCDGKIWLDKGWVDFSNHYSLEFGHFLVFRYDGNSNFHVLIFDRSASEIQYSYTSNNHRPSNEIPEQNINKSKDDGSIQISGDISSSRKNMREKLQSPHPPQPRKKMRSINSAVKIETECDGNSEFLAQQVWHNGSPARNGDKSTSHYTIPRREVFKALERARNSFKSENPSFLVFMRPSYVRRLLVPINFVEKHLKKEHCSVTLCSSSGKTWTATFKQRRYGTQLCAHLQNGWDTFVQDNNVQVGDVCALELINSIEISFKVVIYRASHANCSVFPLVKQKPRSVPNQLNALEKAKAFRKASAFKSENPFFVVVLQPSYVSSDKLTIPVNFAKQYLTKMHKEVILLLSNEKSWPVTNYQYITEGSKPSVTLSNGWHRFAVDNGLEVGDACVFELIKGAETSMKVIVYKNQAVEDANSGSFLDDKSRKKQVEVHESLVIKSEESAWIEEKGDVSNLHGDNSCDASREILDDILMSKSSPPPGKASEEASRSLQTLQQNEAIQETNWWGPTPLVQRTEWF